MAAVGLLILSLFVVFSSSHSIPHHADTKWQPPKSYAALGDSFPAGAGAGTSIWPPYADARCGIYSDAYPIQVANSSKLNIDPWRVKHLACGGMTSAMILKTQVPCIGDSEIVTLTASGNDVSFFVTINECVYHWAPTVGCDAQLVKVREIMETSLIQNLDNLISGTVKHLQPGALFLVTGYPRFYNSETDYCDRATFSQTRPLEYLTKERRRELNRLVVMLNDVIKAAAQVHGAVYVDIDAAFEGHRFCEPGVIEPDPDRPETWFFNLPTPEAWRDGGLSSSQVLLSTEDQMPDPETVPEFPEMRKWRVFHPTSRGHQGISDAIVREVLLRSNPEK